MLPHLLVFAATTGVSTFMLVSALWGIGTSTLNEVIKQTHWPKAVNAVVANVVLIISAALATLTDTTWSWQNFGTALFAIATAAAVNHQFVLKGTGLGDWLQSVTTIGGPTPVPATTEAEILELVTRATAFNASKREALTTAAILISDLIPPAAVPPVDVPDVVPTPADPAPVPEAEPEPPVVDVPVELEAAP